MIDWFTVTAQIVNFLILVALLKHFLYGPIINTMDQREQRLQERLDEADRKHQEAEQEADRHRQQRQELDRRRDELLEESRQQAEEERQRLLDDYRDEAEQQQRQWLSTLEDEKLSFLDNVRQCLADQALSISRQALREIADASLEQQALRVLVHQLDNLSDDDRKALTGALSENDGQATPDQHLRAERAGRASYGPERAN